MRLYATALAFAMLPITPMIESQNPIFTLVEMPGAKTPSSRRIRGSR